MKTARLLAVAALAALPLGAAPAAAAPAAPGPARALSNDTTRAPVINVRKDGGGGGGMRAGGGFRSIGPASRGGGPAFKPAGPGSIPRSLGGGNPGFRAGQHRPGPPAFRGPRPGPNYAWRGGKHHHHGYPHRRFPRGYYGGYPYFYDYGPSYYDSYYYDDDYDDDAVVYANDGDAVARCESRYRSFDRATGTFLANDGKRKLCPYLK